MEGTNWVRFKGEQCFKRDFVLWETMEWRCLFKTKKNWHVS